MLRSWHAHAIRKRRMPSAYERRRSREREFGVVSYRFDRLAWAQRRQVKARADTGEHRRTGGQQQPHIIVDAAVEKGEASETW